MQRATVLVAVPATRARAIRPLLEPVCRIVGETRDCQSVIRAVDQLAPEIVLLDVTLGGRRGADVLIDLLLHPRRPALVVLASRIDRGLAEYILGSPTNVLLPAQAGPTELRMGLEAAWAGRGFKASRVVWCSEADAGLAATVGLERRRRAFPGRNRS